MPNSFIVYNNKLINIENMDSAYIEGASIFLKRLEC